MTHHSQKTISFSLLDRHARNNLQTRRKCPLVTYYKKTASQFHFSRRELDLYDSKTSFIRIWNFGSTRNRWRTVNRSLNRSHLKTDWRLRRVALCGLFFFLRHANSAAPQSWTILMVLPQAKAEIPGVGQGSSWESKGPWFLDQGPSVRRYFVGGVVAFGGTLRFPWSQLRTDQFIWFCVWYFDGEKPDIRITTSDTEPPMN